MAILMIDGKQKGLADPTRCAQSALALTPIMRIALGSDQTRSPSQYANWLGTLSQKRLRRLFRLQRRWNALFDLIQLLHVHVYRQRNQTHHANDEAKPCEAIDNTRQKRHFRILLFTQLGEADFIPKNLAEMAL